MQLDKNTSTNKFSFFFKMLRKDTLPFESQKAHIYKQIDNLLETENKEGMDIFIGAGVKFTKKQVDTIVFKEDNALIYQLDAEHANIFTANNRDLIKDLLVEKVKNYVDVSRSNLLEKKYYTVDLKPKKRPAIISYQRVINLLVSDYGLALFKGDEEKISLLYNFAFIIKKNLASNIESFKGSNFDGDVKKLTLFTQNSFIDKIVPLYNEVHAKKLTEMAKIAKSVEIIQIKDSIVHNLTEKVNNFEFSSLPSNTQKIFMEVASICDELKSHQDTFTTTQSLHFENIVEKRIPQVIQEYITIPEKYRKQLHGNESPDNLLEDSLKEIKNNLSGLIEQVQEVNINAMKKSNTYLKSIPKL